VNLPAETGIVYFWVRVGNFRAVSSRRLAPAHLAYGNRSGSQRLLKPPALSLETLEAWEL
jgi:hypothetical protein